MTSTPPATPAIQLAQAQWPMYAAFRLIVIA